MIAQIESFEINYPKIQKFFSAQWLETDMGKSDELDPDIETYILLEREGKLIFTILTDLNETVGYFVGVLTNIMQGKGKIACIQTDFYIQPSSRGKSGERMIIKLVEERAKNLGANEVLLSSRASRNIGPLFERKGYQISETYYRKVI